MKKINAIIFTCLMAVTSASFADGVCQITTACQGGGIILDPCHTTGFCPMNQQGK